MNVHKLHTVAVMTRCRIAHCSSSDTCCCLQHVKILLTYVAEFSLIWKHLRSNANHSVQYTGAVYANCCTRFYIQAPSVIFKQTTGKSNFWNHNKDQTGVRMSDCPTPMKRNTTTAGYSWSSSVSHIGLVHKLNHYCCAWHLYQFTVIQSVDAT